MGWRPLMESYMIAIPEAVKENNKDIFNKLMEEHNKVIRDLFGWLVQPCLDFIRHECKLFMTTSALHLVHSLLNLYSCILDDFITAQGGDPIAQKQVSEVYTVVCMLYVLVVSVPVFTPLIVASSKITTVFETPQIVASPC